MPDDAIRSTHDDPSVGGNDSEASSENVLRVDLERGSRDLERDAENLRGDRRRRRTDEYNGKGSSEGDEPIPRVPGEPA